MDEIVNIMDEWNDGYKKYINSNNIHLCIINSVNNQFVVNSQVHVWVVLEGYYSISDRTVTNKVGTTAV